jgi:antitoxin VapB
MDTAKLFRNGRSQAVRLPKEYSIKGNEVYVTRINGVVMLVPKGKGAWQPLRESLDLFSEDYLAHGRDQDVQQRRESFD